MTTEGYPKRIPQPGGRVMVYTGPGCGYIEDASGNRVDGTPITELPPAPKKKRRVPRWHRS